MTLYSIFEKPQAKAAKDRAPVAIPERFSWFAMLLTPVFALVNGLWLVLIFWIALVMGLVYASRIIGPDAAFGLYAVVVLFLGFEAPALRRDWLLLRGWQWRGDMISSAEDLAQRDFLSHRK
ncbi:MAG: DUF2628 domain-containing protein [Devosia sp.]